MLVRLELIELLFAAELGGLSELHAYDSLAHFLRYVADLSPQSENVLSVENHDLQPAIRSGFMLEKQSHTRVADIHCFSRFGKRDAILTRPVNNYGNRKGQAFIAALN